MDETDRNKAAARSFVEGMGGDFAHTIDEAMAENCRIVTMGTTAISGERGKSEALAAAGLVLQLFPKGLPTTVHSMIAEGDSVAVEADSFRDGKLISLKEYLDTELAAAFFGGSAGSQNA